MRLLLDENASDRTFVRLLGAAGHDVETSVAVLGIGASDRRVFAHAKLNDRAIITRDCVDFRELVGAETDHPGLLLIYSGGLKPAPALVRAFDRITALYPSVRGLVLSLTEFSW